MHACKAQSPYAQGKVPSACFHNLLILHPAGVRLRHSVGQRKGTLMAKTPTMSDVALLAGVSVGTVSHVLRGSVHVSDALTQRVHEATETLGYRVDPSAQALRMGYQNIVGIGLLGTRKEVEQAACTFLLPFARELGRSGMEALVLSPAHSSAKHLCLEDCTDIVMRAKRSHLHSLLICLSAEFSSCTYIDADAHAPQRLGLFPYLRFI